MVEARQREFDPANYTLSTMADFYTESELACAARTWPAEEIEAAWTAYRAAVDVGDHDTMSRMMTADGRGGNSTFGFFDSDAYLLFLKECWLEIIPNESVWHVIEGGRIVNRWCETFPGTPPAGGRYDYFGINELIYAGDGRFCFQYSLPDLFPMTILYQRWKADGQHEIYGDLYPSLSQA